MTDTTDCEKFLLAELDAALETLEAIEELVYSDGHLKYSEIIKFIKKLLQQC